MAAGVCKIYRFDRQSVRRWVELSITQTIYTLNSSSLHGLEVYDLNYCINTVTDIYGYSPLETRYKYYILGLQG